MKRTSLIRGGTGDISSSSSAAFESRVCDEGIGENVELAAVTLDLVTVMMQPETGHVMDTCCPEGDLPGLLGGGSGGLRK